jgi:hypothetical protein
MWLTIQLVNNLLVLASSLIRTQLSDLVLYVKFILKYSKNKYYILDILDELLLKLPVLSTVCLHH